MTTPDRKRAAVFHADHGVGRVVASRLPKAGWDVVLIGRDASVLETMALKARLGAASADVIAGPLDDRASVDGAVERIHACCDELDGIVIVADRGEKTPIDERDTRGFDEHLEANFAAAFRVIRGALPLLGDSGRIVVVTTQLARSGVEGFHGACASQAAVVGMVRALGLELASKGITVNAVLPAVGETPLGRAVSADEVAATATFLLGPDAGAITGQALNVCGGATA